ncbi:MAG: diversity-generating retroelement protein Avd [Gammaproteobacteria bacterium]|nr:diversity-generating retroelement protein Avd [Gammaproteobacteria bacterium]
MIILTRTFDLLAWLLPKTDKFPKTHRFSTTRRLIEATLDFQERLFIARKLRGPQRRSVLIECDTKLDIVRLYLRLAHHWHWLSDGQYEHVSRQVAELGRLLGGWIKQSGKK